MSIIFIVVGFIFAFFVASEIIESYKKSSREFNKKIAIELEKAKRAEAADKLIREKKQFL